MPNFRASGFVAATVALGCLIAGTLLAAARSYAQNRRPAPEGTILPPGERPAGMPGRPSAGMPGPWDQDVLVHRVSADGTVTQVATFARAGVPTLARLKDGRLLAAHQHFPSDSDADFDKVAVRFSADDGKTWTPPQVIRLTGLPEGMRFPFDPTLVPLPDGRVRLYFTSLHGRRLEEDVPAIYSAISANGMDYTFEPGRRFGIAGRPVIDCAVVLHQGLFHLYAPDNGPQPRPGPRPPRSNEQLPEGVGYHATSRDGLLFTRVADVRSDGRRRWLGNAQSDGQAITFFGTGAPGEPGPRRPEQPRGGVWMATSRDGQEWQGMPAPAIPGADPGAVATGDGGWVVVSTGPPRRGTPSARRAAEPPMPVGPDWPRAPGAFGRPEVRVERVASQYAVAPAGRPGRFVTGQDADLVLGARGFNNTGGALLFNHPTGLATDGRRLLLTDRWNNRVLVWNVAPTGNTPPDLVLGQPDFRQNNPGTGRQQMNWPGNVTVAPEGTVAVTDTNNGRILIWNSFPTSNGAAADVVLDLERISEVAPRNPLNAQEPPRRGAAEPPGRNFRPGPGRPGQRLGWPWGVWTDGKKLAVVATHGAAILIWNAIPRRDHQPPDLVLRPQDAGTPRNLTSDGNWLAVSDHNYGASSRPATMVWRTFPTSASQPPDFTWREWLKGTFTPSRQLVLAGRQSVYIWSEAPQDARAEVAVVLRPRGYRNGDGPDAVVVNGRLYVCNYNGNNILGWHALPRHDDQPPDFSVGSDTPLQDTWAENFFLTNPALATDGRSLFASSDFDRKLFVWRELPDESGAKPDLVFHLPEGPWDNALHGQTLALAGRSTVYLWRKLPLAGEPPDAILTRRIGSVELRELTGVALDERYFYLADRQADRIYVWEGIPDADSEPRFILETENPGRLASDGNYLTAAPFEGQAIHVWPVRDLGRDHRPFRVGRPGQFNLPGDALVAKGQLVVADRSNHRVQVWHRLEDALDGRPADAFLGARDEEERRAEIGRNQLFMPGALAHDGARLWVGEFKFSTRILRFSPQQKE